MLWVWSYVKFRRKYKMDKMLCAMLEHKYKQMPSPHTEVEYASALMLCQQYRSALNLFEDLKRKGLDRQKQGGILSYAALRIYAWL